MSNKKILIIVPTFNRKNITELSLESTYKYKRPQDKLEVWDDHSTEYDLDWLQDKCDEVIKRDIKMGVQWLRAKNFRHFIETDYDFLYITDSDAIHDPNYCDRLLELYGKYMLPDKRKMPVSLYNTIHHQQPGNTVKEMGNILFRKTAPGISQFYDKAMVRKMVAGMDKNPKLEGLYGFDYHLPALLKVPFVQSKNSYLEHFATTGSMHGLNTGTEKDFDRDRADQPTEYLQDIRPKIIKYILNEGKKPEL